MKWVTRAHCHVDRTACAWLIRRWIDADAEFEFVEDPADASAGATPFDIPGSALGHRDGRCTFEVMLDTYGLDDAALHSLARIVHEADIEDEQFDAPEAAGLDAIIRGMGLQVDDDQLLTTTAPLYDGLSAFLRQR